MTAALKGVFSGHKIMGEMQAILCVNTSLVAPGALAHRLQRRTTCKSNMQFNIGFNIAKSKMAAKGPQNGRRGLERGLILGYWALR